MADPCIPGLPAGQRVHFVGVGGVGMAGLARLLHQLGFQVSGSDLVPNRLTELLSREGVSVRMGHPVYREAVDWAVRTPAVSEDNPELQSLRARQVPVLSRGQLLAAVVKSRPTVAVAGAHGKTTTSALIVHLLRALGCECGYAIGGETGFPGVVADWGKDPLFVCEADESDGTLALYHGALGVLTHVEWDHVERFRTEAALLSCYRTFAGQCREVLAHPQDRLAGAVLPRPAALPLKLDWQQDDAEGQRLCISGVDGRVETRLPLPGRHMAENALLALCAVQALGRDALTAARSLPGFVTVGRRFERLRWRGVTWVQDYAHHPTEIRALLQAARALQPRRLRVAFQPHRFSRTRHLLREFAASFDGVDDLLLLPTYAASELREQGVATDALGEACAQRFGAGTVTVLPHLQALWEAMCAVAAPGDVFLIVGAGDIGSLWQPLQALAQKEETDQP